MNCHRTVIPALAGVLALAAAVSLPGATLAQGQPAAAAAPAADVGEDKPTAQAVEEQLDNPAHQLAEQPAVRRRLLLVNKRFELAPAFESTINADYRHTVALGLKGEFHLSDQVSFGLLGFFGQSINTGLTKRILATLPADSADGDPTPTVDEYDQHLNSMPVHGAAYASWTPWYGKLVAFGKAFVNFDFYFQGGLSLAMLTNDCVAAVCSDQFPGQLAIDNGMVPDDDPNNDPALNDGVRAGLYLGGGIHVFLNNWIALDMTVRDYLFLDNPSGFDVDADLAVEDEDSRFLSHLFMGVGVSVFFPSKAKRTP